MDNYTYCNMFHPHINWFDYINSFLDFLLCRFFFSECYSATIHILTCSYREYNKCSWYFFQIWKDPRVVPPCRLSLMAVFPLDKASTEIPLDPPSIPNPKPRPPMSNSVPMSINHHYIYMYHNYKTSKWSKFQDIL